MLCALVLELLLLPRDFLDHSALGDFLNFWEQNVVAWKGH